MVHQVKSITISPSCSLSGIHPTVGPMAFFGCHKFPSMCIKVTFCEKYALASEVMFVRSMHMHHSDD